MRLDLTTDLETGTTSFGDEVIRTDRGAVDPPRCQRCGADLGPLEERLGQRLCGACVEKAPEREKSNE